MAETGLLINKLPYFQVFKTRKGFLQLKAKFYSMVG